MDPLVEIENLKAYYRAFLFGVDREVRAVDDISLTIARGEVYGVAGESSSGKTTLIKTIAGAIRPPLRVVSGKVTFHFDGGTRDIYAMKPEERGAALAASVLHHAGLDECAQSGAPNPSFLHRFRLSPHEGQRPSLFRKGRHPSAAAEARSASARCLSPRAQAACASA